MLIVRAIVLLAGAATAVLSQHFATADYGTAEGLGNLAPYAIVQDQQGFIWAGTQNGLFRHDGLRFEPVPLAGGNRSVSAIHQSVDGAIWIGSGDTILVRSSDRQITETGLSGFAGSVQGIGSGPQGHVFAGLRRGLAVREPGARSFRIVDLPFAVTAVARALDGTVWFGARGRLLRWNGLHAESVPVSGLPDETILGMVWDRRGHLWLATPSLLLRVDGGRVTWQRAFPARFEFRPLLSDRRGRILSGGGSITVCQGETCEEVHEQLGILAPVAGILEDHEGSLWFSVMGRGLVRWVGRDRWSQLGESDGIPGGSVWGIVDGSDGARWIASNSGLHRAERSDGRWRLTRRFALPALRSLAAGPSGELWIGVSNGQILRFDPRTGSQRRFTRQGGLLETRPRDIHVGRDGTVWVISRDAAYRLRPGAAYFEFEIRADGGATLNQIYESPGGDIWLAGRGGLYRHSQGRWTHFTTQNGLRRNETSSVAFEPGSGDIWIGYAGHGLDRVRISQDRIELVSRRDTTSGQIYSVFWDRAGSMWVAHDRGVDRFTGDQRTLHDQTTGFIWDDCNTNVYYLDANGEVWIGTSRGIAIHREDPHPPPAVPPSVVIAGGSLGGQPLIAGMSVAGSEGRLTLDLRALTFLRPGSVWFHYRLNRGMPWERTRASQIEFRDLPAGAYEFELAAETTDGLRSPHPARFSFTVRPNWWQTWWFALAALSVLGAAVFAVIRWRGQRLIEHNRQLSLAVAERTRELVEASRFKDQFLANMSHEMRTPINGFLGMMTILRDSQLSPQQVQNVNIAEDCARSLLGLLNDILDLSKIEAGRMELDPVPCNPRDVAARACQILAVKAGEKAGLELSWSAGPDIPEFVLADDQRLLQVLINLLGNAIKFTEKGFVRVRVTAEPDSMLCFVVEDSGIGIPPDRIPVVFEAFRQVDGSTARRYGGTGLGLAICVRLVELMKGRIWVESQPGRGSTFFFTVHAPRCAAPAQPVSEPARHGSSKRLRILVAEDNAVNQRVARALLEREGHTVTLVGDGLAAADAARADAFDVILMDLQMPKMDGIEATRQLRAAGITTPVIALTARAMNGDRDECLSAGMNGFVEKPIVIEKLRDALASIGAVEEPLASPNAGRLVPPVR